MKILVVEDDPRLLRLLGRGLKREQYATDLIADGQSALEAALTNEYDLMILDRQLPGMDGVALCRELRRKGVDTPILMLTGQSAVQDRIEGLDAGADDYLAKPFAFDELLARVRSLFRRQGTKSPMLQVGDLELDPSTRLVHRAGRPIELSAREFSLLEYMMRHAGHVLSRTALGEHVWEQYDDLESNVINVYINYLRQKIDKDEPQKLIHTVRGAGYVLRASAE